MHLARTAERGKFDFFFLAEGLRLREHRGQIFDLDVVGRPDSLTVLAGLAAVTDQIGLAATLNTTFNEPYELARQFATLDHLSDGRAAWNAVTSPDAFTGENFRRGGFLDRDAAATSGRPSSSTPPRSCGTAGTTARSSPTASTGVFVRPGRDPASSTTTATSSQIHGRFDVPPSPQRYPVQIQAGDSDGGRELAARVRRRHLQPALGATRTARRSTPTSRAAWPSTAGQPDDLKIIPAATAVLGDSARRRPGAGRVRSTASRSRRRARSPSSSRCGAATCPAYDPDGPLPAEDPDVDGTISITRAGSAT